MLLFSPLKLSSSNVQLLVNLFIDFVIWFAIRIRKFKETTAFGPLTLYNFQLTILI